MTTINEFTSVDIAGTVAQPDSTHFTVNNNKMSVHTYALACLWGAHTTNRSAIANHLNLLQGKAEESKKAGGVAEAIASSMSDDGTITASTLLANLKSKTGLSDADAKAYFKTVSGQDFPTGTSMLATSVTLANTTTKQYIQNANTESTILQSKLTALTNNQQAMMDAMSSIVKSLADLLKQEAHNL